MKFKIGDKVRYLNDVGGGIVKRIVDNKHVELEDENGFLIPVLKSELINIPVEGANLNITDIEEESKVEEKPYVENNSYNYVDRDQWDYLQSEENDSNNTSDSINLFIAFVPDKPENISDSDINLFIVNDSAYDSFYSISSEDSEGYVLLEAGTAESNTKVYVSTYKRNDLGNISTFNIQTIFYKKGYYLLRQPVSKDFKIKPSKFFKENLFVENNFFNNNAYLLSVYTEDIQEVEAMSAEEVKSLIEQKKTENIVKKSAHKFKKLSAKEQLEIDLHIEKIMDDYVGLSNGEIINFQLNHFRKQMENAIVNNVKRIVFIHGIGNGTLKHELRKILDEEYHEHSYQDASFKEYGFGATMILL